MAPRRDARTRYQDLQWALRHGVSHRDLVRMAEGLLASCAPGSPEEQFATLKLAELIAAEEPWRSATLARRSLRLQESAHAWAVLGLAHSGLGHYRAAAKAYRRALLLVPENPWYSHNLGHLLDVAFDRPVDALRYLELARSRQPAEPEIASSYAHALARAGRREEARAVLARSVGSVERADAWLESWEQSGVLSPTDDTINVRAASVGPSVHGSGRA